MATASPTAPAPRDCDVAVIGAGPTGLSAAIYTAREGLSTVLLEGAAVGGMAAITDVIDNYPGFPEGVGGAELSERMRKQAERFGAELIFGSGVTGLKTDGNHTLIETYAGAVRAKAVLIATGSTYRQLGVPGEAELIGKGVHFCATCDAPLYRGKHIVAVGGGNSAMQESLFIARFASKVTLLVRGPELKGTEILRQQVSKEPKIEIVYDAAVTEIHAVNGKFAAVMAKVGQEIKAYEADGVFVAECDFTPKWHPKSGKLLGTGHTLRYKGDHVMAVRPRETACSVYDDQKRTWTPWTTLEMPKDAKFVNAGAGSVQRFDLENGDILLPIYFKAEKDKFYRTTVLRCSFDGTTLKYIEHGTELALESGRGVYEPSITRCAGKFYLTLRNDTAGYVAVSDDGLHFGPIQSWKFDDGSELGNYNTQQHWVTHRDRLYLVYNRKGAHNDHVIRHRAPLFMAEVDQKTLAVKRATECILVPERGARLGNFAITEVSEKETWVTVAEWMQTHSPNIIIPPDNAFGADNTVWAARILWKD